MLGRGGARKEAAVGSANEIEQQVESKFTNDDPTSEREDPTFGGCETHEQAPSLQTTQFDRQWSHAEKREVGNGAFCMDLIELVNAGFTHARRQAETFEG